jgi:hypothetical protein
MIQSEVSVLKGSVVKTDNRKAKQYTLVARWEAKMDASAYKGCVLADLIDLIRTGVRGVFEKGTSVGFDNWISQGHISVYAIVRFDKPKDIPCDAWSAFRLAEGQSFESVEDGIAHAVSSAVTRSQEEREESLRRRSADELVKRMWVSACDDVDADFDKEIEAISARKHAAREMRFRQIQNDVRSSPKTAEMYDGRVIDAATSESVSVRTGMTMASCSVSTATIGRE